MSKEIKVTNVSNQHKYLSFKIKGLEDGILVGLTPNKENCLSISYKGEMIKVPFDSSSEDIKKINGED